METATLKIFKESMTGDVKITATGNPIGYNNIRVFLLEGTDSTSKCYYILNGGDPVQVDHEGVVLNGVRTLIVYGESSNHQHMTWSTFSDVAATIPLVVNMSTSIGSKFMISAYYIPSDNMAIGLTTSN